MVSHPIVGFTTTIEFNGNVTLTKRELASLWLTETELKKYDAKYSQVVIRGIKTPLTGTKQINTFMSVVEPRYIKNGDVKLIDRTTFRMSDATPKICKKQGIKGIAIQPPRSAQVKRVILLSGAVNEAKHVKDIWDFRDKLDTNFPSCRYTVQCLETGPCKIPRAIILATRNQRKPQQMEV